MKKLLLAFSLLASMMAVGAPDGAFAAGPRIGTVDLLKLVRNHPNYDSNKALLESTDKDYQKKLDAIKAEGEGLQAEGKKLAEQYRNPMLAAKAKGEMEKQLTEIQQKLMAIDQRYRSEALRFRQDLSDLEARLLKTTTDDLRAKIGVYAKEKGYDFVFEATVVAYAKETYDVTDEILKIMGVDPAKAKGKDEGK